MQSSVQVHGLVHQGDMRYNSAEVLFQSLLREVNNVRSMQKWSLNAKWAVHAKVVLKKKFKVGGG